MTGKPGLAGQYIVITGLGQKHFKDIVTGINNIQDVFKAEMEGGNFDPFKTYTSGKLDCIRLSNRFLTPRIQAGDASHVEESLDIIDPFYHLRNFAGPDFVHCEENVVLFYRMKSFQIDGKL